MPGGGVAGVFVVAVSLANQTLSPSHVSLYPHFKTYIFLTS